MELLRGVMPEVPSEEAPGCRAVSRTEYMTAGDVSQTSGPNVDDLAAEQVAGKKRKQRKKMLQNSPFPEGDKTDHEIEWTIRSIGGTPYDVTYAERSNMRALYQMYTSIAQSGLQAKLKRFLAKCLWEKEELDKGAMQLGYDLVRHCYYIMIPLLLHPQVKSTDSLFNDNSEVPAGQEGIVKFELRAELGKQPQPVTDLDVEVSLACKQNGYPISGLTPDQWQHIRALNVVHQVESRENTLTALKVYWRHRNDQDLET